MREDRGVRMSVRGLNTGQYIEFLGEDYLRTTVSKGESLSITNKKRVFRGTAKHFTQIHEKQDENMPDTVELYYKISVEEGKELHLDSFRLMVEDEAGKQMILDGLLEILFLVSEGKIYDVELNPLNFIAEDKPDIGRVYVKAFYRKDRGLREITDRWLENAKKLIGYFLIADTGINETNFNSMSSVDIYNEMAGSVAEQYLKILKSPSIDKIAREWFEEDVYKQIKGFPPIMSDYREPKDVTELYEIVMGDVQVREEQSEEPLVKGNHTSSKEEKPVPKVESKKAVEKPKKIKPPKENTGKGNKIFKTWGIVTVMTAVGIFIGSTVGTNFGESKPEEGIVEVTETFYDGMLRASVQKYQDAGEQFDLLKEEELTNLSEDERMTVYITYLKAGEYDKALEIDPEGAETVVMFLEKQKQMDHIKEIKTDLPPIQFEKAVLDKDYKTIVELKGSVRDTAVRQQNVIEALVLTGELETAVEYVKEKELEGQETTVRKYFNSYADTLEAELTEEEVAKVDEIIKSLP